MARKLPVAANDRPVLVCLDGTRAEGDVPLTPAEAHALLASASRTRQQLTKHLKAVPDPPLRGV